MQNNDHLQVWHHNDLVGTLQRDNNNSLSFYYDSEWQKKGFAISQQLPLTTTNYPSETGKAHRFFANLLPEAGARTHIVKDLKIANTDFDLLKAIGGECAGALSILPMANI